MELNNMAKENAPPSFPKREMERLILENYIKEVREKIQFAPPQEKLRLIEEMAGAQTQLASLKNGGPLLTKEELKCYTAGPK